MPEDTRRPALLLVSNDGGEIEWARAAVQACCPQCVLHDVADADAAWVWLTSLRPAQLPRLVLFNLHLPKLHSLAVLRRLRLYPLTSDLSVVVYSAELTQAEVLMGYRAGANSFVVRPQDETQFKTLFSEQLSYWLNSKSIQPASAVQ